MNKDAFLKKALSPVPAFLASCALDTVWDLTFFGSLLAITVQSWISEAVSEGHGVSGPLSLPSCVCVKLLVPPSPARRCGHARLFITSLFPVTYYSSGQDGWQDVCGALSNSSSLRAPTLSFGPCCYLAILSTQARGRGLAEELTQRVKRRSHQCLLPWFHL